MPFPGGPGVEEAESTLRAVAGRTRVVGMGLTGLRADAEPVTLAGFAAAAGL